MASYNHWNCPVCEQLISELSAEEHYWKHKLEQLASQLGAKQDAPKNGE